MEELISELDHAQEEIDEKIEQIQNKGSGHRENLRWSSWTTRGQRQNPRYDDEYELLVTHNNENCNIEPMNELDITKHVIGVVFTQYLLRADLTKFKKKGD